VTCIFRKFEYEDIPGPGFIKLKDRDEIPFGKGKSKNIEGPLPAFCNLHYAVARIFHASVVGATGDFPTGLANMAKLLMRSGKHPKALDLHY
jgi:hypothetical protein